ncbi:MAG: phosphoethanolamine transferase [Prevotella sp.]|nr:phosphoethanolamine transferase [Prevotella sp.]
MDKINKYIKQAGEFLWSYKFTILCLAYFCVISVLALYIVSKPALVNALSFVLILNILAKTKYSLWISIILAIFVSFDAYFAFVYSNQMSIGTMASILETNPTEAAGVMSEAVMPAIAVLVASLFLILMSQRELKASKLSRKVSLILLLGYWVIVMPAIAYWKIKSLKYEDFIANMPVIGIHSVVASNFPLVYGDMSTFIAYQHEMYQMRKFLDLEKQMPTGVQFNTGKESPEKIFFIIGESAGRSHYSLYGYPQKTSPFFDSLAYAAPDVLHHYDAYSPASITRDALRIILSFSTPKDVKPFFENFNIIDLANKAGYETVWISNQDKVGESESYIGFVSANATESYFEKDFAKEDLKLLTYIQEAYKPDKKQFFVVHLLGSHVPYNERYDEEDALALPGKKTKMLEYDRSIHHTDRLLRNIYDIMQQDSSSVLYYFSDHAELVDNGGHGVLVFDQGLFDVPLVTINNSPLPVDSIVYRYIDPETSLINTSSSIYILSEIMGYEVTDEVVEKATEAGKYIFHVDKNTYPYIDMGKKYLPPHHSDVRVDKVLYVGLQSRAGLNP